LQYEIGCDSSGNQLQFTSGFEEDDMSKLRVSAFTISLDGYGAGPGQGLEAPLGEGGEGLHGWMVPTRTFQAMYGKDGTTGVDDDWTARGFENLGAWIMGRNMFGPVRGPWPDGKWKGWWGSNPPYHVPVFVLTHHERPPLEMEGGTVFHFVTGGIEAALERARAAAGTRDIRVGGGAATIRQYLEAKLIDEMHVAISPVMLGGGEALFAGLDLPALGYEVGEHVPGEAATHVVIRGRG
jgi:dihydrofolate reductase